jgi:hypothetical protein
MGAFARLKRCFDLSEEDVAGAIEARESTLELLRRLVEISQPNGGAAKSLLVLARMATTACEWLDGDLRIEVRADGSKSVMEILSELGLGMRERVFPTLVWNAPLEEFSRAIERVPHMVKPLEIRASSDKRIVLGAAEEIRRSSLPPPPVVISEESFYVPKAPAPVKVVKPERAAPALPLITPQLPVIMPDPVSVERMRASPPPTKDPRTGEDDEEDIDSGWDDS